jgi:hypothetical protein
LGARYSGYFGHLLPTKKHALLIERLLMMDAVTGEEVANIPCDERFEQRFGNPCALRVGRTFTARCLKRAIRAS